MNSIKEILIQVEGFNNLSDDIYEKISSSCKILSYKIGYQINKIGKIEKFKIKFLVLRNYFYKNILAFGDVLHKVHPLAGQGFNMTIRDIITLSDIIDSKIDLGQEIDASIGLEFEKKLKHINFIFSSGIDFIYKFFNFDNKINNKLSKPIFNSTIPGIGIILL